MAYFEDIIKTRDTSKNKAACFIVGRDSSAEMGFIDNIIDSGRGDWELAEVPDQAKELLMQAHQNSESQMDENDTDPAKWIWVTRSADSPQGYLEDTRELVAVFKG